MKSYRIWLSFAFFLNLSTAQAQDSFYEREPMKVRPKRTQLVVQIQGLLTPITSSPIGSNLFSAGPKRLNLGYEFMLGTNYNNSFEISTGVRRVAIYSGYTFKPFFPATEGGYIAYTSFASYWQIPVQLKFCIWKPLKTLSFWSTLGGAIAFENDGIQFLGGNYQEVIYSANKKPKILNSKVNSTSTKRFISGDIGIDSRLEIKKRIGLEFGVRRLFSRNDLLAVSVLIKDDVGMEYQATNKTGLNTFCYKAGVRIYIGPYPRASIQ